MSEIQVASRYAKSLIDLAQEQNALEAVKSDIEQFIRVGKENPQLLAVLKNPIIRPDKKSAILENIFGASVSKVVIAFFNIVTKKGRAEVLYATAKEFINQYNNSQNIVKASVVSAIALSDDNRKEIIALVKQATSGNVILNEEVDADLIGGFVLTVGDKQVDTSIANKLNKLKKDFAQKVVA